MPVIAVAAAMPAATASGVPVSVTNHGLIRTSISAGCAGTTGVDGTPASGVANYGLSWSNVASVTTPISVTFYFDATGLIFTSSVAGWSTLSQQSGSAALTYKFDTSNCKTPPLKFRVVNSKVNGAATGTDSGVIVIANQNAAAALSPHSGPSLSAPKAHASRSY